MASGSPAAYLLLLDTLSGVGQFAAQVGELAVSLRQLSTQMLHDRVEGRWGFTLLFPRPCDDGKFRQRSSWRVGGFGAGRGEPWTIKEQTETDKRSTRNGTQQN